MVLPAVLTTVSPDYYWKAVFRSETISHLVYEEPCSGIRIAIVRLLNDQLNLPEPIGDVIEDECYLG